jgi:hypothetical protein
VVTTTGFKFTKMPPIIEVEELERPDDTSKPIEDNTVACLLTNSEDAATFAVSSSDDDPTTSNTPAPKLQSLSEQQSGILQPTRNNTSVVIKSSGKGAKLKKNTKNLLSHKILQTTSRYAVKSSGKENDPRRSAKLPLKRIRNILMKATFDAIQQISSSLSNEPDEATSSKIVPVKYSTALADNNYHDDFTDHGTMYWSPAATSEAFQEANSCWVTGKLQYHLLGVFDDDFYVHPFQATGPDTDYTWNNVVGSAVITSISHNRMVS